MSPPAVVLSCSRFCSDVITVHHAFTPRPRDRVVDLISRAGLDRAEKLIGELPGTGHFAMHLPLENTAQSRRVAAAVADQFGRADILVNSAGFTRMVPHADLEALDDDLIDAVLKANVRGAFATIRAFAPLLRTSGNGLIVNISSGAAARGGGSSIYLQRPKTALDTMSMALVRCSLPRSALSSSRGDGPYRLRAWSHRGNDGRRGGIAVEACG